MQGWADWHQRRNILLKHYINLCNLSFIIPKLSFTGKLKDSTEYDWGIEDIPMDFDSLMAVGSMSGSGGVIVMDDTTNMVEALANINYFYAHESVDVYVIWNSENLR